ncbi:hypothetical protein ANO11243_009300 [Dothideomycetidae sp. 11243]|nr:hypothetical protein ANO11243_009300 [fungal sp. No.11243]
MGLLVEGDGSWAVVDERVDVEVVESVEVGGGRVGKWIFAEGRRAAGGGAVIHPSFYTARNKPPTRRE